MNVILNVEEAEAILGMVTSKVLDDVDLPEPVRERIRDWRRRRALGTAELDRFTEGLNEAIGNHIDERTTKMLRQRGHYVSETEVRLPDSGPVARKPRPASAPPKATPAKAGTSKGAGTAKTAGTTTKAGVSKAAGSRGSRSREVQS